MDFKLLSEKMGQMQDKIRHIDDKVKSIKITKESGAGLVKATVTGEKRLIRLDVDEQLLVNKEKGMLEDLVVAAVNLALDAAEEETQKEHAGALQSMWKF